MDFYLRLLRPPAAPKAVAACSPGGAAGAKGASSKNRRLAKLHRLVDEGEYFSDEAMRARAPLLHFHYVAQVSHPSPAIFHHLGASMHCHSVLRTNRPHNCPVHGAAPAQPPCRTGHVCSGRWYL